MLRTTLLTLSCSATLAAQSPTTILGPGCGGVGGAATIALSSPLGLGYTSSILLDHLPPAALATMVIGWSNDKWGTIALPAPLASYGMPGCDLRVRPDIAYAFVTGSGAESWSFTIGVMPFMVGLEFNFQAMFSQPGLNATGIGLSPGLSSRIEPGPTPTAWITSLTQFGITYQFAAPVLAGQFVNDDWFVVGPVTISDMWPPSTSVNGRVLHGAMVNPNPAVRDHGYDGALFGPGNEALYHPMRNVAWGLSPAAPLVLHPNQSLVKVVSNTDPTLVPYIRTCSVLTALAGVPPAGSFRPPYAGPDHAVRYSATRLDWSALAALQPAPGQPDIATFAAHFERPWLDHSPTWTSRYLHPVENMPDYGRDLTSLWADGALLCNLNVSQAERRTLLIRLVQIGIDFWGNVKNGCYWEGTGGHGSGRKFPILFAGALLHDPEMLAVGANYPSYRNPNGTSVTRFGEDCQTFYVTQTSATEINWGFGGYTQQHLGLPEFGFSHVHWPNHDHEPWLADPYRLCCTANAWIGQVLCARVMGLRTAWQHDALFDYMDRYVATQQTGWTFSWSQWAGAMWQLHRPNS